MKTDMKAFYYDYDKLLELLKNSDRDFDYETIDKSYQVAAKAHLDQKRVSGVPYILHPTSVAYILAELGMDTESIAAALLHDVVEDTAVTIDDVRNKFGNTIANLVDGVTKLGKIPFSTKEEQQAENVRKMLVAMYEDIRVIIIKLADRLQNTRTIECMRAQKRRDKARENMEVYAPIAHRLGIRAIKEELEDLSLRQLDPIAYKEIQDALTLKKQEREAFIESIKRKVQQKLSVHIRNVHLEGRVKSINGIYRKMFIKHKFMEEIYDIYAVRVIVSSVNGCYNALGIIHDIYRPIPNRFKDYISTPKPNLYQSLHTTVIGKEGIPFEVQIRTWEMHRTAEYGIAAHWKYKLGLNGPNSGLEDHISWIKGMIENHKENALDIIGTIKSDLIPEEVFVLTPKGDVVNLPSGANVIDFAYAIHSEVGNKMVGAKVDKRIVPISYEVKTGQIVEILTTKDTNKGPTRDWLSIVKTSEARNKIKQWFKKEKHDENIAEGKLQVEKECRKIGLDLSQEGIQELAKKLAKSLKCETADKLFEAIGYSGIPMSRVAPRIKNEYSKIKKTVNIQKVKETAISKNKSIKNGVVVEGIDNCLVHFSKCCNPIPGDEIIGFITRGHGVSVHKKSCLNVPENISESSEKERWINVHWRQNESDNFKTNIKIIASDSMGLLANITSQISKLNVSIHSMTSNKTKDRKVNINITITVKSREHLSSIISKLSSSENIISVSRI